jgi:ABC-2 type transport system permease protein
VSAGALSRRRAGVAITARSSLSTGALLGTIVGCLIGTSARAYTSLYPTPAARRALAMAYEHNTAMATLFGPAHHLDTVSGFTMLKVQMTCVILTAIWGFLTSTRLLRGNEDDGRTALLLTGTTSLKQWTGTTMATFALAILAAWVTACASAAVLSSGLSLRSILEVTTPLLTPFVVFFGVGGVSSQLVATRRAAAAVSGCVLAVSYLLRAIADAGLGLYGLVWFSPLGWVEIVTQPGARVGAPWVAISMTFLLLGVAGVVLSGRRDVGSGLFDRPSTRSPRRFLIGSPLAFSLRALAPSATVWGCILLLASFLYGLVAKSAGATLRSGSLAHITAALGASGSGAQIVLGLTSLIVAITLSAFGVSQLSQLRNDEECAKVDLLLMFPVTRARWLLGRLVLIDLAIVVGGAVAGLAMWAGATIEHSGVAASSLVAAGCSDASPALALVGLVAVIFGVSPRSTVIVGWAILLWSAGLVLVAVVGSVSTALLATSVFHHLSAAPAVPVDVASSATMAALGGLGIGVSVAAFSRRDLIHR